MAGHSPSLTGLRRAGGSLVPKNLVPLPPYCQHPEGSLPVLFLELYLVLAHRCKVMEVWICWRFAINLKSSPAIQASLAFLCSAQGQPLRTLNLLSALTEDSDHRKGTSHSVIVSSDLSSPLSCTSHKNEFLCLCLSAHRKKKKKTNHKTLFPPS